MIEEKMLFSATEHIKYELDMFNYADKQLQRTDLSDKEKNVYLETFVIHTRCLLDFLYTPENVKPDDILAEHYIDNPEVYIENFSEMHEILKKARNRANKDLAHLTYSRVLETSNEEKWTSKISEEITLAFAKFLELVTSNKREWFH